MGKADGTSLVACTARAREKETGDTMASTKSPKRPRNAAAPTDTAQASPLVPHEVPPKTGPDIGMPQGLRSDRPDRATRALLRMAGLVQRHIPQNRIPLKWQRRVITVTAKVTGRRLDVAKVTERTIAGPGGPIALRIFTPTRSSEPRPAFVWCHGGGFILGGLDTADS